MTSEDEERVASLIRVFKFQSFIWNEEQVFFPTDTIDAAVEFFQFFSKWQDFENGKIGATDFIASQPNKRPFYVDYFLSATSDTATESEAKYESRQRLAVISASEQGYPSAAFARYMYSHDGMLGFREDKTEALRWLQIAAQSGHYRAMQLFGLYLIGAGEDVELGERYVAVARYYLGD